MESSTKLNAHLTHNVGELWFSKMEQLIKKHSGLFLPGTIDKKIRCC